MERMIIISQRTIQRLPRRKSPMHLPPLVRTMHEVIFPGHPRASVSLADGLERNLVGRVAVVFRVPLPVTGR